MLISGGPRSYNTPRLCRLYNPNTSFRTFHPQHHYVILAKRDAVTPQKSRMKMAVFKYMYKRKTHAIDIKQSK